MKDEAWQKVNREHVWMGNYAADCMQYASPCASYADGSVAWAIYKKSGLFRALADWGYARVAAGRAMLSSFSCKIPSPQGRSGEREMKGGGAVIKRERADGRD